MIGQSPTPALLIKEINDTYTQSNFKNLREYFNKQNQLFNFNFVEFNFPAAVQNQKVAHGLALIPQDVIITRLTGAGSITLNWSLFDANNLDITTTDACRIRLFVGSYWNFQTTVGNSKNDSQSISPVLSTIASLASSISSAISTAVAAAITALTPTSSMPSGSVVDFGGATAPSGWLLCDGSAVLITAYPTLFAAIGTLYGVGDGSTTFNIPDCRGRVVAGKDDMGGAQANRLDTAGSGVDGKTLGGNGGSQNVAITTAQLPGHAHGVLATNAGSTLTMQNGSTNAFAGLGLGGVPTYIANAPATGTPFIQSTGSGVAHNNVQPTIVMNKIIKT